MSKELKVTCNRHGCWKVQQYRGQKECIHCGQKLNDWSVASQLRVQRLPQATGEMEDYP
jgi:hypothetical protein